MTNKFKKFKLWIPLLLLFINITFISFMIEELVDASVPNYGEFGFLTPIIGLASFLYIRKFRNTKDAKPLVQILQGLNWLFIFFPIAVIAVLMLAFI